MRGSQATLLLLSAVLSGLSACAPLPTPTPPLTPARLLPSSSAPSHSSASLTPPPLTHTPLSPTPLTPPPPACLALPGQLEADTLPSQHLPNALEFLVYLPPCYNENAGRSYPVLYLLHGQYYDETQWPRIGAPDAADRLIAAGETPPFIIVMPYDPSWKQPTEYGFGEALTEELIPYLDAHYRTLAGRDRRAIGGLSRGAGWAIRLGLTRPDLFGALGAHSPIVFWSDFPHLAEWLAAIPPESLPRIRLDIGEDDRELQTALELEELLDRQDIPHEWRLYPGAHEEAYWRAHVEEYLRWYASAWH